MKPQDTPEIVKTFENQVYQVPWWCEWIEKEADGTVWAVGPFRAIQLNRKNDATYLL